jgi:nickel transport protein
MGYGAGTNCSLLRNIFTVRTLLLSAYCLLLSIYLLPTVAYAHKVSIYAYAEDGMVFAEGYFSDGTRTRNSLIEVFDTKTGKKLLEGKTDNEGKFSFKIPKATSLKLVLHASMGHRNDYTLSAKEVKEAMGIRKSGVRSQKSGVKGRKGESKPLYTVPLTVASGVSSAEIEAVVSKAMDRKLQPVITILLKLKENSEKPGITEILGGIGYIIGLMGIAMYFKSRRKG